MKVLCVAEKPSISKAVADHLSGGHKQTVSRRVPGGYLAQQLQSREVSNTNFPLLAQYASQVYKELYL